MKKKFLFFLLTAVCTLLCAPPSSAKVIIHDNGTAFWPSVGVYYTPGCSSWSDAKQMYQEGDSKYYSYNIGDATTVAFMEVGNSDDGNKTNNILNPVNFGIYTSGGWKGTGQKRNVTKTGDATFAIHGSIFVGTTDWTSKSMTKKNGKWLLEGVELKSGDFGIKVLSGTDQAAWLFAPTSSTGDIVTGTAKPVVLEKQGGGNIHSKIVGTYDITFDPDAMTVTIGTALPTVGALTFTPASGTIKSGNTVAITCATDDVTIYYTVDGTDPKTSATRKNYNDGMPVMTTTNKRLRAYASKDGYNDSAVKDVTYKVMPAFGPDFKVYIGGSDFKYIGEGETWNGAQANWDDWETELPPMKWDAERGWYTMTIQPQSGKTSFSYGFLINSNNSPTWFNLNQASAIQNDVNEPSSWSAEFSSDVGAMTNSGVSDSRQYKVFLKQNPNTGAFLYAITRVPQDMKPYTVKLNISQMGARKWDSTAVAVAGGNTYNSTSLVDDVITFSFSAANKPSKIYFKATATSTTATPVDITDEFDFVDGKTYTIGFINTYKKDRLTYAWREINLTQEAKKVNLPYGPNDFKEPKYFLVGTRMGNWHLQPEWELIKQDDGTYKVNGGRFVYRTNFGVAKVNSYYNYTQQIYQLVTRASSTAGIITSTKTTIEGLAAVDPDNVSQDESSFDTSAFGYQEALDPDFADTNFAAAGGLAMTFAYNGAWKNENYENAAHPDTNRSLSSNDKGTWVESITLTPKNNGQTYDLSFAIDKNNVVNIDQRMFTLVGSDINHKGYLDGNYSPDGTDAKIVTNRSMRWNDNGEQQVQQAWQEAWIQYDENGKPYYDGNGQFLYHTAFVPSIFDDTEVKFQIDDVNGKKFDYSSSAVTFVEANQLSDLKNDPYRELYKALAGQKEFKNGTTFSGGNKVEGTDFSFKLGEISRDFEAGATDWKVFVIRDAWVKGEFKIWNGWSGNSIKYEMFDGDSGNSYGDGGDGARWNKLNAGAATAKEVTLTDVNAGINGTAQIMDKLYVQEDGTGVNFHTPKVGDKYELQYYNRIILLYNTAQDNALDNSYVIFIQDDTQPVIKAFAEDKTASYEWDLLNVKTGSDAKITGYTITRYTVTADGNINPKVVASGKDLNWSVDGFQSKTGTEENELNPGTYFYNLKINYLGSDGEADVREANSNRFVIYGDAIAPQLRVEQLIVLTKAGYDAIMGTRYANDDAYKSYPNLKTRFQQAFRNTNNNEVLPYAADRFYLTYINDNLDADHYAIYAAQMGHSGDAMNQNITLMTQVSPQEVINFMKEPDYYKWAARFYVRALDKTAFDREYSRQNITVEDLEIKLTDNAAADLTNTLGSTTWETNSKDISTSDFTVRRLSGGTTVYRGSIVDRNGFLGAGTMSAVMTYKYGDKEAETRDEVEFTPVVPLPYDLSAHYEYRTVDFGNPIREALAAEDENATFDPDFKAYLKINTHSPMKHAKAAAIGVSTQADDEPYEVYADETAISQERHLDCVIEFTRPNVSQAIFEHYNVLYTIHAAPIVDTDADAVELQDYKFSEVKGTYYDASEIETDNAGNRLFDEFGDPVRNPYQFRIKNTHPSGKIYPEFQISTVIYERAAEYGGDEHRIEATYQYDPLRVVRKNTASATMQPGQFGLGVNPGWNEDYDPKWFLYGHTDLTYTDTTPSADVNPDDFAETKLFLFELTNKAGVTVPGQYLWFHDHNKTTLVTIGNKTWRREVNPFFINSLAVEDGEIPQLTLTPIYLFIRGLQGEGVSNESSELDLRDLVPYVPGQTKIAKRRNVKRRAGEGDTPAPAATPTFQLKNSIDVTKNEAGVITGATYDATNHPELVVSPGTYAALNDEDAPVMTGIEDVMTDGETVTGEAVYYNLQGIQVANPVKGQIYIRKAGNVSEKVVY